MQNIIDNFIFQGEVCKISPISSGHINTTYKVITNVDKYILQKINTNVFKDVDMLMYNIISVTNHIQKKGGKLHFLQAKNGCNYAHIGNDYYRMYKMIDGLCVNRAVKPSDMFITGLGFGEFQMQMSDFDKKLAPIIPDFHDTQKRYEKFVNVCQNDVAKRLHTCENECNIVNEFAYLADKIISPLRQNIIPMRIAHNDTKINNIIIDANTLSPICVIDLDTVMEGSLLFDFGDAVRSGCNSATEDEINISEVKCDLDFFTQLCRGYFIYAKNLMTNTEKDLLALSGLVLTYECAMRFLTDYLENDIYFKIDYPTHNLVRAKSQLALLIDLNKKLKIMEKIVKDELEAK